MKKIIAISVALLLTGAASWSQTANDFSEASQLLRNYLTERTTIRSYLQLDTLKLNGRKIDLVFGESLSDFTWRASDETWFRDEIEKLWPEAWKGYKLGEIFCGQVKLEELVTGDLSNDGKPVGYRYRVRDPFKDAGPLVQRIDAPVYEKGLSGRHISVWQSHGRYYEPELRRWEWQRATNFTTVEDMYTQSYVIPFLIPMLENAGAYVLTPRERDTNPKECICDNDPAFERKSRQSWKYRKLGKYSETGEWSDAGTGFADAKPAYTGIDNPFTMGTVRMASCLKAGKAKTAEAVWTADIQTDGNYAVYVSYKTLPNSTESAHYTVHHAGGEAHFSVNQKMGGSTWIYLGTFDFRKDSDAYVTLDNTLPAGRKYVKNSVITADAVRFGGGMGKIARGNEDTPEEFYTTSGLPSYAEGSIYWLQWAGADTSVFRHWKDDYTDDYSSRGAWTSWMLKEKNVPFDLSFAFHTDAGSTFDDGIIGSLSIYTLLADGSRETFKGIDRMSCRLLADHVQEQICDDIRADFEPNWNKRQLWNRSYSESRTTSVPGMLLELLSHDNLADMKYGLDPAFRFTVSRAIYKGMLKTLSDLYAVPYAVQPLPVHDFSAALDADGNALLSWEPTEDVKEPTARAQKYIIQTRIDGGAFDDGITVEGNSAVMRILPEHVYSFRVTACNEGGKSFPSEVLSVARPASGGKMILVVNNFDRISSPSWYDTRDYAGFDGDLDHGVPYGYEINFIGEEYNNRRNEPWTDDDNTGFGANHSEYAGRLVAGNTFDFVASHAQALLELGYCVSSASHGAFEKAAGPADIWAIDLLCGKQVTTKSGSGARADKFQVFPEALQSRVRELTGKGVNVIISGANIATDAWSSVYPVKIDENYRKSAQEFCTGVLGYKFLTGSGSFTGRIHYMRPELYGTDSFAFQRRPNEHVYCVENPDGIVPAGDNGTTIHRYTWNEIPASVFSDFGSYKVCAYGFPLEVITGRTSLFKNALEFLNGK